MSKYNLLSDPITNYKASKNLKLNVDSYFLSLAHSDMSGYNVCPLANQINKNEQNKNKSNCSSVCVADNGNGRFPNVQKARIRKPKLFFENQAVFMDLLVKDIEKAIKSSQKTGNKPTFRLNAYSDIIWEKIRLRGFNKSFKEGKNNWKTIFEIFPNITFYDYTKIPNRKTPKNYELTYSFWGNNRHYKKALKNGLNVAMVFDTQNNKNNPLPLKFDDKKVIDGDITDLRTKQNDGNNVIVGLRAKMSKANIEKELSKDISFVVKS